MNARLPQPEVLDSDFGAFEAAQAAFAPRPARRASQTPVQDRNDDAFFGRLADEWSMEDIGPDEDAIEAECVAEAIEQQMVNPYTLATILNDDIGADIDCVNVDAVSAKPCDVWSMGDCLALLMRGAPTTAGIAAVQLRILMEDAVKAAAVTRDRANELASTLTQGERQ